MFVSVGVGVLVNVRVYLCAYECICSAMRLIMSSR